MSLLQSPEFSPYTPAILRHNSHGYVVEYYFYNPYLGDKERRTIKLNRVRNRFATLREFREYANSVVGKLNIKLASGWSPAGDVKNTREYVPMGQILTQYITEKKSEVAKNTMFAYSSFCDRFRSWLDANYPDCNCAMFNRVLAVKFMEFVWTGESSIRNKSRKFNQMEGHVTERTYNNNLKLGRAFFSWCIEKCYAKENPFEAIKPKREKQKQRTIIPAEARKQIDAYFGQNNPSMQIICRLVYTSLIRPIEVSRIKVEQLLFDKQCIKLPPEQTKNGRGRYSRMDDELMQLLRIHIKDANPTDFLFGSNTWKCAKEAMNSHTFGKAWNDMRQKLKLPSQYQLYSLRDSGIHDLLIAGVVNLDVMHAAGHSNLNMTTKYADHIDDAMIQRLNEKAQKY